MDELTDECLAEIERDIVNDPYEIHPDVVLTLTAEVRRLRKLLAGEPITATGVAEAVFGTISVADSDNRSGSGWAEADAE